MSTFLMNKLLLAALLFSISGGATSVLPAAPTSVAGTFDQSIEVDGQMRTYRIHIPDLAAPPNGLPVVIVLHGGGGNAGIMQKKSDFDRLADEKGFIVVYPNGSGRTNKLLTWNAHNCCAYAFDEQIDDVGFISALIDQLVADYDVDPARIYITGHSNGAMMTYRLGCELADKIAAIAPVAGALNTDVCDPVRPLPVMMVHGTADGHVPIAGGDAGEDRVVFEGDRMDRPFSHAVDTWLKIDQCPPSPVVNETGAETISIYKNCAAGTEVAAVVLSGWGHQWPTVSAGAPLDASSLIWEFVSQFSNPEASA